MLHLVPARRVPISLDTASHMPDPVPCVLKGTESNNTLDLHTSDTS